MRWRTRCARIVSIGAVGAAALGGCVGASDVRGVSAAQQRTINAIAESYTADYAMLHDALTRMISARRVLLLGAAHREMLTRGYVSADLTDDPARFRADLSDASASGALVTEVRTGRMSAAEAEAFLHDYSLSLRMSDDGASRDDMLARLGAVAAHDAAAAALRSAMESHGARIAALLADADANARTIGAFGVFEHDGDGFSEMMVRALWNEHVLDGIDDPAKRAAAERLIDRLFALETEGGDG